MAELERIETERLRFVSRKALHEHRLARLAVERDRLFLGVFVLLGASVVAGAMGAFDVVADGGFWLCLIGAVCVRGEWRRAWRETWVEHEDYIAFMRAQLGEAAP